MEDNELYFTHPYYESQKPPKLQNHGVISESLFQFFGVLTIMFGAYYLWFRWTDSLNFDALWFAIPLVFAETMMFIGTILVVINFYMHGDTKKTKELNTFYDGLEEKEKAFYENKNIIIDVFIPIFNESPELISFTVNDAKKIKKRDTWEVRIVLLDDSGNEEMTKLAKKEGLIQITRDHTKGRKAGAIVNAIDELQSDFVVVIDSDTRVFPDILLNTMDYFSDPHVAWVQTPQWFYDLPPQGDVFSSDPQMFFDVIQRRRNGLNASFCTGATSLHRVSALRRVAIARWVERVLESKSKEEIQDLDLEYVVYHASEDIYTSIVIHGFENYEYKSVYHPQVESKMLSPQDLLTWTTQRFRYAGGTIDLITKEWKRFLRKGLTLGQKLMYFSTFWSYTGAIWLVFFIASPIIYMFTNIAPVSSYSMEFFKHLIPFLLMNQIALMIATWNIHSNKGAKFFIAIFPLVLEAFITVAQGKKINFNVTSKVRQEANYFCTY